MDYSSTRWTIRQLGKNHGTACIFQRGTGVFLILIAILVGIRPRVGASKQTGISKLKVKKKRTAQSPEEEKKGTFSSER